MQEATSKRRRVEDQDSGSSGRSDCRYEGCKRPTFEKARGVRHQFCGLMHRDLFMSYLADMIDQRQQLALGSEAALHITLQKNGVCKLNGCNRPAWKDPVTGDQFDFCRKSHALEYIETSTRRWSAIGRLCKLPSCYHHVSVDEDTRKCHEWCSFEHAKVAAGAKGRAPPPPPTAQNDPVQVKDGTASSSEEFPQRSLSEEASPNLQVKTEKDRGYHEKIQDREMEECLRANVLNQPWDSANADPRGKFKTGVNIAEFHPWEIVNDFRPRYFLHAQDANQSTQRSTKEGFGWKQTSTPHSLKTSDKKLQTKYFNYEYKDKEKSIDHVGDHVKAYRLYKDGHKTKQRRRWKMHEIVLMDRMGEEIKQGSPRLRPVIWKIFQDRKGGPVWPPLLDQEGSLSADVASSSQFLSTGPFREKTCNGKPTITVSNTSVATFHELETLQSAIPHEGSTDTTFTGLEDTSVPLTSSENYEWLSDGLLPELSGYDDFSGYDLGSANNVENDKSSYSPLLPDTLDQDTVIDDDNFVNDCLFHLNGNDFSKDEGWRHNMVDKSQEHFYLSGHS